MSKAEDRAKERYWLEPSNIETQEKYAAYVEGYHQAEKDLSDISWIKEVSGVNEMSRAKEEALKAYPPQSIAANYATINRRDAFEYGYLKAEKDLELTWKDIKLLIDIIDSESLKPHLFDEIDYQEVLKRFKKQKGEKV